MIFFGINFLIMNFLEVYSPHATTPIYTYVDKWYVLDMYLICIWVLKLRQNIQNDICVDPSWLSFTSTITQTGPLPQERGWTSDI